MLNNPDPKRWGNVPYPVSEENGEGGVLEGHDEHVEGSSADGAARAGCRGAGRGGAVRGRAVDHAGRARGADGDPAGAGQERPVRDSGLRRRRDRGQRGRPRHQRRRHPGRQQVSAQLPDDLGRGPEGHVAADPVCPRYAPPRRSRGQQRRLHGGRRGDRAQERARQHDSRQPAGGAPRRLRQRDVGVSGRCRDARPPLRPGPHGRRRRHPLPGPADDPHRRPLHLGAALRREHARAVHGLRQRRQRAWRGSRRWTGRSRSTSTR